MGELFRLAGEPLGIMDGFSSPPERRAGNRFNGFPFAKTECDFLQSPFTLASHNDIRHLALESLIRKKTGMPASEQHRNARLQATRELGKGYRAADHRTRQKRDSDAERVRNLARQRCFDVRFHCAVQDAIRETRSRAEAKRDSADSEVGRVAVRHTKDKGGRFCPSWAVRGCGRLELLGIDLGFRDGDKSFESLIDPDLDRQAINVMVEPPSSRISQTPFEECGS